MAKIPLRVVERILKESGAERISKEAKILVAETIEEEMKKIALLAIRNARHFGHKLITAEDIKFAKTQLKKLR